MSEASEQTETFTNLPFERWVQAARGKPQLWRTAVGTVIILVVWLLWTFAIVLVYALVSALDQDASGGRAATDALLRGTTPLAMLTLMATFLGLWLGVWLATRLMHGQKFLTVISPESRVRWRELGIGVAIIAVYAALNSLASLAIGLPMPEASGLSLSEWAIVAIPVIVLVFFQSSGEELFFRGYLMQHLAARFRSPLVWGLLPAIAFASMHYANGSFTEYSAYYVVATGLFAIAAAVTVWRTGSLSMAMGMHTANNVISFLVIGSNDGMNSTQLYLMDVGEVMKAAPYDMAMLTLMLLFVLSPWAPMPKLQPFARRKDTRAAP